MEAHEKTTVTREVGSDGSAKYGPMTIREWIGGGFLVVIALLMWNMIGNLNEFMRTTLTENLTKSAVAQTETRIAVQQQTKATEEQIEKTDDLGDYVKDLGVEVSKLGETNKEIVNILRDAERTNDAHSRANQ